LANTEEAKSVLVGHGDAIQSIAFNPTGTVLATTCRDRKLRLFDPRAGGDAVRITDGHGGVKGARVTWMGDLDRLATTGFSKMSDRQVSIWETSALGNVKTISVDQSSGVVMPFWTDNNILFLAGKGDGNIRFYEYEADSLYALSEHKSSDPQRGMCFLPRRALNVSDCEIARAYKVYGSSIEPIAFIVPRKADSFQSDIYPPAPSSEAALTAAGFFSGKTAPPKLVNLENGAIFSSPQASFTPSPATFAPTLASVPPTPTSAPQLAPSKSYSAPTPVSAHRPESFSVPTRAAEPTPAPSPVETKQVTRSQSSGGDPSSIGLREENNRLTSELREAREKIRNLELQVEGIKANAQKAMSVLMQG